MEDSAQKSAYLSEDNEDTGGTTVDMNTSLASTMVACIPTTAEAAAAVRMRAAAPASTAAQFF